MIGTDLMSPEKDTQIIVVLLYNISVGTTFLLIYGRRHEYWHIS